MLSSLNLPRESQSAVICGQTECGKTQFVLDELLHPDHGYYRDAFEVIFILCPTWKRNGTYLERPWLWRGHHASRFHFIDPGDRLHEFVLSVAADTRALYLIDDMAASKTLTKKKDIRFGCSSKSITRSAKTSVSRPNGSLYSIAKTAFRLQMCSTSTRRATRASHFASHELSREQAC